MIETIRTALQGYKTYIVAAMMLLAALLSFADGSIGWADTLQAILVALGFGTLRAGVASGAAK